MYTNSIDLVEKERQMLITQKSRYGLRAVFELAKHFGGGPLKIADVAKAQAIPHRFLEAILRDLKQSGIVDSRRGSDGGYFLLRPPETLTVDEVIIFLQGPIDPMECDPEVGGGASRCELYGDCVFQPMWVEARNAVRAVFEETTFSLLVAKDKRRREARQASSPKEADSTGEPQRKENNAEVNDVHDGPVGTSSAESAPSQFDHGRPMGQFGPGGGLRPGNTAMTSSHAADGRM
jgi:Rrf2 family transcriptional regulator, cysteine metabolism repressor